jgi:CPA1 family monovalent cation:H+ antiporter
MAMVLGLRDLLPGQVLLISITFGVVLFSLLGQGLTIETLVKRLGLQDDKRHLLQYQKLLGEKLAIRAALSELKRFAGQGIISDSVSGDAAHELLVRAHAIDNHIKELHLSNEAIVASEKNKVSRIILNAQKNALREAAHKGTLDWNSAQELSTRFDSAETEIEEKEN